MTENRTSVLVSSATRRRVKREDAAQKPKPIGWTNQLVLLAEEALDRREQIRNGRGGPVRQPMHSDD